jgi:AraC-like DNA-binding protein
MPGAASYRRFDIPPDVPRRQRPDFRRTWWYLHPADAAVQLTADTSSTPAGFRSRAEVLAVGDASIVDLAIGATTSSWPRSMTEASDLLRLSLIYRAPGRSVWNHGPNRTEPVVVLLTGRIDGRGCAPAGVREILVAVRRAALPFGDAVLDRVGALPLDPGPPVLDALVRPMLAGMLGRLCELSRTAGEDLAHMWISAVSLLVRSLAEEPHNERATVDARRWQVRRYIEDNLADPELGPDTIAAALHLSRRSLDAVLAGGEGPAAMIRRARVRRAVAMLGDPGRSHLSVAGIGAAVGFARPAHFSRLVRAECGRSPRELRARAGVARTPTGRS